MKKLFLSTLVSLVLISTSFWGCMRTINPVQPSAIPPESTPTATAPLTLVSSPTGTATNTPVPTSTFTATAQATLTYTPTATGTSVPTPAGVIQVGPGSQSPSDVSYCQSVSLFVPMLQFRLDNPANTAVTITGINVTESGTGNDGPSFLYVGVFLDGNENGIYDAADTKLAGGFSPSDNGIFSAHFSDVLPPLGGHTYLLCYGFMSGGENGTYQASIASAGDITGEGVVSAGLPINSRVVTMIPCSQTPTISITATRTFTAIPPASTLTATATATVTETPGGSCPTPSQPLACAGATVLYFTGNLNSAQPAAAPGGFTQLGSMEAPVLPFMIVSVLNPNKAVTNSWNGGNALFQLGDITQPSDTETCALLNHTQFLLMSGMSLETAKGAGTSTYAWNLGTLPAACTAVKNVTDSSGTARQVSVLFYQVNDLGTAVPPVNPDSPHQVVYAWYAFETTGGQQPDNTNLLGGTGVYGGDITTGCGYDSLNNSLFPYYGESGYYYSENSHWGDFLYFNSDGSLASEGGVLNNTNGHQWKACIYLPPSAYPPVLGYGDLIIQMNFGTAGMPGYGQRDGITGDAAPSLVN